MTIAEGNRKSWHYMDLHPDFRDLIVEALPSQVKALLEHFGPRVCVAGGFCRDIITGDDVRDIDLFFSNVETFQAAETFFIDQFEWGPDMIVTANATTFITPGMPKVQLVKRVFIEWPDDLIKTFDFTICQVAIFHCGNEWIGECSPDFWEDLTTNNLRYTSPARDEDPGGSVVRMVRFANRGYKINETGIADVLGRFYSQLSEGEVTEETAREKIRTAFRRIGYAGRQTVEDEVPF